MKQTCTYCGGPLPCLTHSQHPAPMGGLTATQAREQQRRASPTEQRRTIEARLDRLKKRLDRGPLDPSALAAVLKGTLDLLTDVLLEDDHG